MLKHIFHSVFKLHELAIPHGKELLARAALKLCFYNADTPLVSIPVMIWLPKFRADNSSTVSRN
jgi:hypothetical protein